MSEIKSIRDILWESQTQCDDNGVMIQVSRQAMHEFVGEYDTMVKRGALPECTHKGKNQDCCLMAINLEAQVESLTKERDEALAKWREEITRGRNACNETLDMELKAQRLKYEAEIKSLREVLAKKDTALKSVLENFNRDLSSGNFLGDDDHEMAGNVIEALATQPPKEKP